VKKSKLDKQAEKKGYYYDPKEGERIINFVREMCPSIHLCKWQAEVLRQLTGWINKEGVLRYKTAYISTAKRNGKTIIGTILELYALCKNQTIEVYSAANSREQSSHIYRELKKLIIQNEELNDLFECTDSTKVIVNNDTLSNYKSLTRELKSDEGLSAYLVVFDELWLTDNRGLFDSLRMSIDTIPNAQFVIVTTAGEDRNNVCYEMYQIAKNNKDDITFYSYIAEADEKDDWTKKATWKKANPGCPELLPLDRIESWFKEAKNSGSQENVFRHKRMNQWIACSGSWVNMSKWDLCTYPVEFPAEGSDCYGALDLSSRIDMTCYSLLFPIREDGEIIRYDLLCHFWIPEETALQKETKEKIPYSNWKKYIEMTPGNAIDQDYVFNRIVEINSQYHVRAIGTDPWQSAYIGQKLEKANGECEVIPITQNYKSYDAPMKLLEAIINEETLNHWGNPVLRWHASNLVCDTDSHGNYFPTKKRSKNKIDGMVCLAMALALHLLDEDQAPYQSSGIEYF
jgi:phage terminase large subunit-like protein